MKTEKKTSILIIDDDVTVSQSIAFYLKYKGNYNILSAYNAVDGILICDREDIDVILLDCLMPNINGIDALPELKKIAPLTEVVMITAYSSLENAQCAMRAGARDFILKPMDMEDLVSTIEKCRVLREYNLKERRQFTCFAEENVYLKEKIRSSLREVSYAAQQIIQIYLRSISMHDNYTLGHSNRVADIVTGIMDFIQITEEEKATIALAAKMHDIGKFNLNSNILSCRKWTRECHKKMMMHVTEGANMVKELPDLGDAATLIYHHHERINGTGYNGVKGNSIPLGSRIIALADAIDAMMNSRYRQPYSREYIYDELLKNAGIQFDSELVSVVIDEQLI